MENIKQLIRDVLNKGKPKQDRTGIGRISLFGPQLSFDLTQGFPALTIKKLPFKTMTVETLWFLQGKETCEYLDQHNCKIWREWTHPILNSVGPMYGKQLRHYPSAKGEIDQFKLAIEKFKSRPFASDNVITLWNPATVPNYYDADGNKRTAEQNVEEGMQALANCHGTVIQLFGEPLSFEEAIRASSTYSLLEYYRALSSHIRRTLKDQLKRTEITLNDADRDYIGDIGLDIQMTVQCMDADIEEGKSIEQYREQIINDLLKLLPNGQWAFYPYHAANPFGLREDPEYPFMSQEAASERLLEHIGIPRVGLRVKMYQRSQDLITAVGFNVGQYALLTHIIARLVKAVPLEYIQTWGDVHIYQNHVDAAFEMLRREPYPTPQLHIKRPLSLDSFDVNNFKVTPGDFELVGYESHPAIQTDIAV